MTARTLEMGRAVLASSSQELELWLTTLITISPVQHSLDIQQLSPASLLDLLSSGTVWSGRGPGMRVKVTVSLRGEPLPNHQMRDLIFHILEAPVWKQLRLTLEPLNDMELQPDTARFSINHTEHEEIIEERRYHRISSRVPAADTRPPKGVPSIDLGAVHFIMDVLQPKQRPSTKRSRPAVSNLGTKRPRSGADGRCGDTFDNMSGDPILQPNVIRQSRKLNLQTPTASSTSPEYSQTPPNTSSPPNPRCSNRLSLQQCKGAAAMAQSQEHLDVAAAEFAELQIMVDGAMRLSVDGLSKSRSGIKVKASTFHTGLVDVVPSMWRPGYLIAMSQRAHLLPTISRSFSHVAIVKGIAVSLRDKIERLNTAAADQGHAIKRSQDFRDKDMKSTPMSDVTDRLWVHLQKSCVARPLQPLQAFVATSTPSAALSDSEDILEHMDSPPGCKSMQLDTGDDKIIGPNTRLTSLSSTPVTPGSFLDCKPLPSRGQCASYVEES
ncbi:hypothetical protein FB567DRAFT_6487 [Paraphoma chrysanthemicola]|uniref:Uncharacterized protein n=1 Tax=Paraphoma chrysanthemicola TaxID=798071 RepID=A0A8K0W4W0_9PLEO|nr:hypothetical protein FB567DRAFT_6487 [Paraphoma chrysanthemicola]